jgi:proteasome lid subunit RPN8/RPN11
MDIKQAIAQEANTQFPSEACGFLLDYGGFVICNNVAEDPQNSFLIPQASADLWWETGRVTGVWHSHSFDPAIPSELDELLAQPELQCWIYSVMDEDLGVYLPDDEGRLQLQEML